MKTCENCPFLKVGGIRKLCPGRCKEITYEAQDDRYFPCHKHAYGNAKNPVCRGAMTFLYKQHGDRVFALQSVRHAERFGLWSEPTETEQNAVFDSLEEMEAAQ